MSFKINKHTIFLSVALLIVNACSTKQEIVSVSEVHLFNNNYGIVPDPQSDALLKAEEIAMESQEIDNKNYQEEFYPAPGTFLAKDFVPQPEIITYKYKFDPKFYSKAEWRTME